MNFVASLPAVQNKKGTPRRKLSPLVLALTVGLGLTVAAPAALAVNSDPDPTFGTSGVVRRILGASSDMNYAAALQADGMILEGGNTLVSGYNRDFGLIRHKADGTPDFTFGDGTGKVITGFTTAADSINSVVALPGGGILAAGYQYAGNYANFALVKYTAAGALDTTFGGGTGKVTTNSSAYGSIARGVALQPDGKYVVVGDSYDPVTKNDFYVVRYNADGSLDTSFGVGGKRRIPMTSTDHDYAFGVAIQPDGKIVVAGDTKVGFAYGIGVARLTPDGNLDATFGASGKVAFSRSGLNSFGRGVAVQPDGKIVVVGNGTITSNNSSVIEVLRFTDTGALDTSFNGGGLAINGFGGGLVVSFSAVELLPTGQILVGGRGTIPTQNTSFFLTARYTAAGLQDSTYNPGSAGFKLGDLASYGYNTSAVQNIAVQPDGMFIASGYTGGYFGMVRYQGDTLDVAPNAGTFTDANAVAPSTLQISDLLTVSGLTAGALVPVKVTGGSYSINGNPATSNLGYAKNGDQIMVSHTSAAASGASVTTTLKVGGLHAANNRALILGAPITATFTSTTQ